MKDEGQAKVFCPDKDHCPPQIKGTLVNFLSRKAMNVFAGDANIEQLYNKGYVRTVADLYDLDENQLLHLDGWKHRMAQRFLESLRESVATTPFDRVLYGLGIRFVGEQTAKTLARHFRTMDALSAASREELLEVEDVGEVIADSILEWFSDPVHQETVSRLRQAGLKMEIEEGQAQAGTALAGMSVVVSGTFSISRDEMKTLIERSGGKISSSVSAKTGILLAGEKPGPEKIKKAQELGVRILSEEELRQLAGWDAPREDKPVERDNGTQLSLF